MCGPHPSGFFSFVVFCFSFYYTSNADNEASSVQLTSVIWSLPVCEAYDKLEGPLLFTLNTLHYML